ncbi:hypothetical protein EFK50_09995 [Nocardioides marmoriginsengisoli]|uniref:ABM domain-containing protein n=1 Tax=Nocardioides marmoriginsengisoli TaxID=661483 RepID=A0A3N0CFB2_9ACTN|nr:hypothetical protein [Nocardioides marmoriginsengisoli]RNL62128.1 hypothetical protein EFK50_09995 [Nocardioides marmoriginsengisoli]
MYADTLASTLKVDTLDHLGGEPMATLMLTMELDPARADEVLRQIRGDVIPWVRRLPGFSSGHWVRSVDKSYALVLVEFGTEAQARDVADLAAAQRSNPDRSWSFDRIVVAEELAVVESPPSFGL